MLSELLDLILESHDGFPQIMHRSNVLISFSPEQRPLEPQNGRVAFLDFFLRSRQVPLCRFDLLGRILE